MKKYTSAQKKIPLCLLLLSMVGIMLHDPAAAVESASASLQLWSSVIVPALLPFFIISELLVASGAAAAAGRWLAPLMRPLFNLPGSASLAVVLGFCSGFPTGAALTAALWRERLLTDDEAARLLAFTNNAGPLYLTAAVATGLLQLPKAAILLAISHYGLNLLLGIALGCYSRRRSQTIPTGTAESPRQPSSLPPLTAAIKTAAQRAAANILLIGCLMMFFAVAASGFAPESSPQSWRTLLSCLLEITLGTDAIVDNGWNLSLTLPLLSAQLAFGGLSVQAQVMAMTADCTISPRYYLLSRPLHAAAATILTALLLKIWPLVQPAAKFTSFAAISLAPISGALAALALLAWIILCACLRLASAVRSNYQEKNT